MTKQIIINPKQSNADTARMIQALRKKINKDIERWKSYPDEYKQTEKSVFDMLKIRRMD